MVLNTFEIDIKRDKYRGKYDIAQDLWCEIQKSGEYIHSEYTMKYFYFEGEFECDDMEELCEKGLFDISAQWDILVFYDIWKSKKGYYIYFMIPSKYENVIGGELSSRFTSKDFPANINSNISDQALGIL